jgi:hypothetical protein
MDRVSSNIIVNDFNKEKEKQMKKTASKKTQYDKISDLVDSYIDDNKTDDELIEKLLKLVGKEIIRISEMEYTVYESGNYKLYLCCREIHSTGGWVDVSDLTELKVWEYNLLVDKLSVHYPDYPIERLESRFV